MNIEPYQKMIFHIYNTLYSWVGNSDSERLAFLHRCIPEINHIDINTWEQNFEMTMTRVGEQLYWIRGSQGDRGVRQRVNISGVITYERLFY